ncbi:CPBP family intramembrane glutamic endopeptidase [Streptomyces sp. NRRL S-1521]|uniref:CPBP family intramembrane glutamic endopeptidase n=1 Tax=Streptomyces sp. NRRL S-1521 TaxID=1609100 RepID=UPI00099EEE12|nr:CPBP family intramembrane glutamic endopeptidase [Streptomyces sp. NRRL S-1521]
MTSPHSPSTPSDPWAAPPAASTPSDPWAAPPAGPYPPYAPHPYEPEPPYVSPPLPYHRLALVTGRHRWWRPVSGTALVLGGAVAAALLVLLGAEIAGAALGKPVDKDGLRVWGGIGQMAQGLLSLALLLPVVFLAARWVQRRPGGTVSSVVGRLRWDWLVRCLLLALPLVAASLGVMLLLPGASGDGTDDMVWAGLPDFLLGLAMVCVLVPFQAAAEEYVFRGWLTQAVGAWCRSPWVAILPQAPLFAAAHGWGTPWGFLDLVVFALVTGVLTLRTGGLEAAIGLHVISNLLAMGLSAAIAGALASDETAADMDAVSVCVDVVMICGYAALVLWWAGRRKVEAVGTGRTADDEDDR